MVRLKEKQNAEDEISLTKDVSSSTVFPLAEIEKWQWLCGFKSPWLPDPLLDFGRANENKGKQVIFRFFPFTRRRLELKRDDI